MVLVLAVDEARALLNMKDDRGDNYFRLLRRALKTANDTLRKKKLKACIFAVVVDTNSQIHDFVPPTHQRSVLAYR